MPGDEAIVPSLTFVATANAVRYTGAMPVFADIAGENDLNISYQSIERAITERTRAILVMHYGGYACDMPSILELAREHNLKVIEDAAHAVGSDLDGRKLGTWGDMGCFSFFSNKNMTTGEGGMLITDNETYSQRLHLLRSHGMTSLTWDRHKGHAWSYDVVDLGYNYRIDEIRSALGKVQLGKLPANNERRRHLTEIYRDALAGIGAADHRSVRATCRGFSRTFDARAFARRDKSVGLHGKHEGAGDPDQHSLSAHSYVFRLSTVAKEDLPCPTRKILRQGKSPCPCILPCLRKMSLRLCRRSHTR